MSTKNLTCIVCPMGCSLTVTLDGDKVLKVEGNTCPRGEKYAIAECTAPVRTVTSTVKVEGSDRMLPVKTAAAIPKDKIFECMDAINAVTVSAPKKIGDIIISDVCHTGIDIVATANI